MKKIFYTFIFFYFSFSCQGLALPDKEGENHQLYFVTWHHSLPLIKGLKDYLNVHHFPYTLTQKNLDHKTDQLNLFVLEAKKQRPDIIITHSTAATLGMIGPYDIKDFQTRISDIPVVFVKVADPIQSQIVEDLEKARYNVTGSLFIPPLEKQFQIIEKYFPFSKIGFIYDAKNPYIKKDRQQLQKLSEEKKKELFESAIEESTDQNIKQAFETLKKNDIDLLYLASDPLVNKHRNFFIEQATENNIPVFSLSPEAVQKDGALISVYYPDYVLGQLTGKKVMQILKEKMPPEDLLMTTPTRTAVMINMATAKRLNKYPPLSLLENAEIVGLMSSK